MSNKLKHGFRQIKKFPTWIYFFPALLMRVVFKIFFRVEIIDPNQICENPRGVIGLVWHNRLLFLPTAFPARLRKHTFAMVSASRDGQYLSDFLKHFSIRTLRGSSSRKGANALLGAINAIDNKCNVIITPDGPRGPKYRIKKGAVMMASKTGAPLVPVTINSSKCWQLKSWDNFQIPKPGAKLTLIIGDPINVPQNINDSTLEDLRIKIEQALLAITSDPQ
ncbi:MAG: lysophospholipid acyltransferase family protein [Lentisphaeria bacterium]|nr:lysophospholipid acyltransferase family protein [Lentisphaeria bacterium]